MTSGVVDDAFGAWTYLHCRPVHLAGLVDHIWLFDGAMTCLRERTFPNGLLEIIVHLGERYRVVEERGAWLCPTTCLTGLQLRHLVVEAPPQRTTVIGIRLTPAGAFALLGRPMHELSGLTVDLEDVMGSRATELASRCDEAPTVDRRVRTAVRWVEENLERAAEIDPAVAWMVGQMREQAGTVSIGRLRERTGWSKTRLTTVFGEQVGVTPKQYARILRFTSALKLIHAGNASFAEIAAGTGYYDQPHLNGEFKELSGFTPREFQLAHRYANSVSVAEG